MTRKVTAIVIAQPSRFRESIQILLSSISEVDEILSFGSLNDAISLTTILAPSIVILDSNTTSLDLPTALKLIGETWQGASRIVLVEDKDELQRATTYSTDLVLLKGFNASKFIDAVEEMLKNR